MQNKQKKVTALAGLHIDRFGPVSQSYEAKALIVAPCICSGGLGDVDTARVTRPRILRQLSVMFYCVYALPVTPPTFGVSDPVVRTRRTEFCCRDAMHKK